MTDDPLPGGAPPPPPVPESVAVDFARYRARRAIQCRLQLLDSLERAIGQRDAAAVCAIIDEPEMRRALPGAVRDEAIAIVHLPPRVHRAPVNLYRHQHALSQLGDDAILLAGGEVGAEAAADDPPDDAPDHPPRTLPFACPHRTRGRRGSGAG